jgi:catechol-2,3-dioxygenase
MNPKARQNPINANVRIGHVHLKVADLDRSLAFYRDVLGFEVTQRLGSQAVFLSAGGYHHHIGLNTWESAGSQPPTGLEPLAGGRLPFPHHNDLLCDPGVWRSPGRSSTGGGEATDRHAPAQHIGKWTF